MLREKEYVFQDNVLIVSKIKILLFWDTLYIFVGKRKKNILQNFVQNVFKWR